MGKFEHEIDFDDILSLILGAILCDDEDDEEKEAEGAPAEEEEDEEEATCDNVPCCDCEHAAECLPFGGYEDEECLDFDGMILPCVERITFNDPATIVHWADGDKTVVKCMPGEKFERYAGFAAACMKKLFGSTSAAKAIMDAHDVALLEKAREEEREAKERAKVEREMKENKDFEAMFHADVAAEIYRCMVEEEADKAMQRPGVKKLKGQKDDEPSVG